MAAKVGAVVGLARIAPPAVDQCAHPAGWRASPAKHDATPRSSTSEAGTRTESRCRCGWFAGRDPVHWPRTTAADRRT